MVNGRSAFGVGDDGQRIPIGSIIIDDAHACLSSIEEQFSISIQKTTLPMINYSEFLKIH